MFSTAEAILSDTDVIFTEEEEQKNSTEGVSSMDNLILPYSFHLLECSSILVVLDVAVNGVNGKPSFPSRLQKHCLRPQMDP